MNLDIKTGVLTAIVLGAAITFFSVWLGIRSIQNGMRLPYFRKRRERVVMGWRLVIFGAVLGGVTLAISQYAEPTAYRFFPPSPTVTITPTITETPTISLTPSITLSPTITDTPAVSPTPAFPEALLAEFSATTEPNPNAVFSPVVIARQIDDDWQPVAPATEFENPIGLLYGTFSYDQMSPGSQWTALWYRLSDGKLICYETKPWDGGTGGYNYTECQATSTEWTPGDYDVQIFVGTEWNNSGRFTISGEPPLPSETATKTSTSIPTMTRTQTPTRGPSPTLTVTNTRTITLTPTVTRTLPPTSTVRPSATPRITDTRWPTQTVEP